jgi:trk system potassium uptake protein
VGTAHEGLNRAGVAARPTWVRGSFRPRHPTQLVVIGFAAAITVGTALLLLPMASTGPGRASVLEALFTATSAVCVTGLVVVDTPTYWSNLGEVVILVLIQLGGFGLMTVGSLVGLLVSRRIGLRRRMTAQAETGALDLGDVRQVVVRIAAFSLLFESATATVLTLRLWTAYGEPFGQALYHGVFHAVSAFNNAGFALYSDSLMGFVTDPFVNLAVCGAIVLGGLGFPVLIELKRRWRRPARWSLHTKLTVSTTVVLLVGSTAAVLLLEWTNPATLGPLDTGGKALAGLFQAVNPRTAGFNTVDTGALHETTWLFTSALMFIGGGSASTAGGIKVTTFALIAFVIWSETRGDHEVMLFNRRSPPQATRQALAVALLGLTLAVTGTFVLLTVADFGLGPSLFEAFSAFGTVGLSTGITAELPDVGQVTLIVLMFVGRVGPITLFAALALRPRQRLFHLPEERPIIG